MVRSGLYYLEGGYYDKKNNKSSRELHVNDGGDSGR